MNKFYEAKANTQNEDTEEKNGENECQKKYVYAIISTKWTQNEINKYIPLETLKMRRTENHVKCYIWSMTMLYEWRHNECVYTLYRSLCSPTATPVKWDVYIWDENHWEDFKCG